MVNLKSRIEDLKKETGSLTVKELCEKAQTKLSEINEMSITREANNELESAIIENLLKDLKNDTDPSAKTFVLREERFFVINNLGVKTAISAIKESDISSHPALSYTINHFEKLKGKPEYLIAENFYSRLQSFEWHPVVKENLKTIKDNAVKFKEDIIIHKAIYELKNSRSSYILSGIRESLDDYLLDRSKSSKAKLVEKLAKFTFDPLVRNLANAIRESHDNSLDIKSTNAGTEVEKIYSPVIITENSEIFAIGNDVYEKSGKDLSKLSEDEISKLDPDFINVVSFINGPHVKVTEGLITIYTKNKKIELTTESISVNGKTVSKENFEKIYMNTGVFRRDELSAISSIIKVHENFDNIVEIEFAKRFRTPLVGNRRIDVIKLEENLFVTKEDPAMGRVDFFTNLNATQTRSIVLEFMNYDIYEAFGASIAQEESKIKAIEESKKTYIQTITQLEEKLLEISKIDDEFVKESEEFKAIVKSLKEEIDGLKEEYANFVAKAHEIVNVPEVTTNEEVEPAKVTIEFKADMRVHCKVCDCDATVTAVNDTTGMVSILCDDGTTMDSKPADLTVLPAEVTGVKESEVEIKVDGKKVEISTEDDDESDDDDESKDDEKSDDSEEKEGKSKDDDSDDDKLELESQNEYEKAEDGDHEDEAMEDEHKEDEEKIEEGTVEDIRSNLIEKPIAKIKDLYKKYIGAEPRKEIAANIAAMVTMIATMAAENKALAKSLMLEATTEETVSEETETSTTSPVDAVAQRLAKMNNASKTITEDHAETETPAESTEEFKAKDKVETKDGRYGTVQGVNDTTGKITVAMDDGETCECDPSDLVIVKETGVNEGAGAGDEIELEDGRRGQVQGADDNTGELTILTDEGETLTVPKDKVKVITDKSSQKEVTEERVEGQQSDGNSVEVKESDNA